MPRETGLPTFKLEAGVSLAQALPPDTWAVTLDAPALHVMTDLTEVKAATTPPTTTLRQAEQLMIHQGVRMLFVVSDMPAIVGLVTTTDLHGDRQMQVVAERMLRYDELTVADVMTTLEQLDAIDFASLRNATVGDVIHTLKRFGRNHLLVAEGGAGRVRVRGVISRSQIERQLGEPIDLTPIASSFSEIERALV